MKRLYLPSLGIINALGGDAETVWRGMSGGDQSGIVRRGGLRIDGDVHVGMVGENLPALPYGEHNSRNNRLLHAAYRQIAPDIGRLINRFGEDRIAVVLGSSTSGISETEDALAHRAVKGELPPAYRYSQHEMGSPSQFLAAHLGLRNAAMTISTACSSSAKAFGTARNLINAGFCDAALVGGVDTLCRLTLNGFHALESISPSICNPFSRNRNGITIGEGAALFILSPEPDEIEFVGYGDSSDAYHMSAPEPEGAGACAAIQAALDSAGIEPARIDYINLHGTATARNDAMESAAVSRLFRTCPPCSSTKALTGHTLGAAGATELGLCWLALSSLNRNNELPRHIWDGAVDDTIARIRLITDNEQYDNERDCYMMSNSFAFGGSNTSLIIKKTGRQRK